MCFTSLWTRCSSHTSMQRGVDSSVDDVLPASSPWLAHLPRVPLQPCVCTEASSWPQGASAFCSKGLLRSMSVMSEQGAGAHASISVRWSRMASAARSP